MTTQGFTSKNDRRSLEHLDFMFKKGTFFIENKITNEWLTNEDTWTKDPLKARVYETEPKALSDKISLGLNDDYIVTEHEFI